jgi:hypothetical protein
MRHVAKADEAEDAEEGGMAAPASDSGGMKKAY